MNSTSKGKIVQPLRVIQVKLPPDLTEKFKKMHDHELMGAATLIKVIINEYYEKIFLPEQEKTMP